jgi:hypothetical protein
MKRRAPQIKLLLFLLAGAIINVAVAWGCAARGRGPLDENFPRVTTADLQMLSDLGWTEIYEPDQTFKCIRKWDGWTWQMIMVSFRGDAVPPMIDVRAGWPCLALCGGMRLPKTVAESVAPGRRNRKDFVHHATVRIEQRFNYSGRMFTEPRWLPYFPLWRGFAINTIFYAGVLWVLFAAPLAIRKRVRRKRGQCAACGYSLRGGAGDKCPECGATA